MSYIVVNMPAVSIRYKWSLKDSLDGIVYDNFGTALQQSKILGASGVAEVGEMVIMKEVKDEEARNNSKD